MGGGAQKKEISQQAVTTQIAGLISRVSNLSGNGKSLGIYIFLIEVY